MALRQITLRNLTDEALKRLKRGQVEELIPEKFRHEPYSLKEALAFIHRPTPDTSIEQLEQGKHPAQIRLIKEELLAHNLSMLKLKQSTQKVDAQPLTVSSELEQQFLASLPFSPTGAQAQRSKRVT